MQNNKELKTTLLVIGCVALIGMLIVWLVYRTKQEETYEISVILGETNAERWAVLQQGMESAANNYKVQVSFYPISKVENSEEQITLLARELDKQVDAIVIDPVDSEKIMQAIQKTATNTQIVLLESDLTPGFVYPQVTPDNYAMGQSLGETLKADKQQSVGVVLENTYAVAQLERLQGLKDSLKESGIPIQWSILGPREQMRENRYDTGLAVDAIVALDSNSTEHAVELIQEKDPSVYLYGVGNTESNIYYLDKGLIRALVIPNEYNMGYLSIETALKKISRLDTEEHTAIEHIVVTKHTLYDAENQRLVFPFVQ